MKRILLLFVLFVFVYSIPVFASVGPIMLGNFQVYVQDWKLETPSPVICIDKFGLRKGYYIFSFEDHGKKIELPIYPRNLTRTRLDRDLFADWKSEKILCDIAKNKGKSPISVSFEAVGTGWIIINQLKLAESSAEIDVPPDQEGWKYFVSGETILPDRDELIFDKNSLVLALVLIGMGLPTSFFLDMARRSVSAYLRN